MSPVTGAPRRKNGRQQACEPCRRRKVACDHRMPVCSRCRRGRISERCVYVTSERQALTPLSPSPSCCKSPAVAKTPDLTVESTVNAPRPDGSTGFLGATSFPAFYQGSQSTPLGPESQSLQQPSDDVYSRAECTPRALLDLAVWTLQSIPDQTSAEALIEVDSSAHDGWCRLVGERLHASLWSVFGNYLNSERNDASMMHLATKINENTTKAFKEHEADPDEWIKSFSGPALRWEALGHLFVYWSYGARGIQEVCISSRCKDIQASGALELMKRYKICASWCMELSRVARTSNTLLVYLAFKHCQLESHFSGETSK